MKNISNGVNRIDQKFITLAKTGKPAFMPFIVGGDPDFKSSLQIAKALSQRADFLEIGFPYSDPLADGPTIQAADRRALKAGATTDSVFRLIKNLREFSQIPITVLVYANLVLQRGVDKFYRDATRSGIDGALIPDAPVEEADKFMRAAAACGIRQIFLVAQTTDNKRLKSILKPAAGFLYLVSVLGVTGARKKFHPRTMEFIKRVRKQTALPLCVGFGVSTPAQYREMIKNGANGAIVGSAIVNIIEKNLGKKSLIPKLSAFMDKFK